MIRSLTLLCLSYCLFQNYPPSSNTQLDIVQETLVKTELSSEADRTTHIEEAGLPLNRLDEAEARPRGVLFPNTKEDDETPAIVRRVSDDASDSEEETSTGTPDRPLEVSSTPVSEAGENVTVSLPNEPLVEIKEDDVSPLSPAAAQVKNAAAPHPSLEVCSTPPFNAADIPEEDDVAAQVKNAAVPHPSLEVCPTPPLNAVNAQVTASHSNAADMPDEPTVKREEEDVSRQPAIAEVKSKAVPQPIFENWDDHHLAKNLVVPSYETDVNHEEGSYQWATRPVHPRTTAAGSESTNFPSDLLIGLVVLLLPLLACGVLVCIRSGVILVCLAYAPFLIPGHVHLAASTKAKKHSALPLDHDALKHSALPLDHDSLEMWQDLCWASSTYNKYNNLLTTKDERDCKTNEGLYEEASRLRSLPLLTATENNEQDTDSDRDSFLYDSDEVLLLCDETLILVGPHSLPEVLFPPLITCQPGGDFLQGIASPKPVLLINLVARSTEAGDQVEGGVGWRQIIYQEDRNADDPLCLVGLKRAHIKPHFFNFALIWICSRGIVLSRKLS